MAPICDLVVRQLAPSQSVTDLTDMSQAGWIWATFCLLLFLCLIGAAGNLITIVVFSRFVKHTTVSLLIVTLSLVDLLVCTTLLPVNIHSVLTEHQDVEFTCRYKHFGNFAAIPLSGTILLLLAVQRFLKIWFPQHKILTKLRTKLAIGILVVMCIVFAVPQSLAFSTNTLIEPQWICDGTITCSLSQCKPIDTYISLETSHALFTAALSGLIVITGSFVVLYALILVKAYRLTRNTPLGDRSRIRQQTAITFLLVTLTFVLAYTPMVGIYFSGMCNKDSSDSSGGCEKNTLKKFMWNFLFITHAVNPIIYAFNYPEFKSSLLRCFAKLHKNAMRRLENSAPPPQDCQTMVTASAFGLDSTTQL